MTGNVIETTQLEAHQRFVSRDLAPEACSDNRLQCQDPNSKTCRLLRLSTSSLVELRVSRFVLMSNVNVLQKTCVCAVDFTEAYKTMLASTTSLTTCMLANTGMQSLRHPDKGLADRRRLRQAHTGLKWQQNTHTTRGLPSKANMSCPCECGLLTLGCWHLARGRGHKQGGKQLGRCARCVV